MESAESKNDEDVNKIGDINELKKALRFSIDRCLPESEDYIKEIGEYLNKHSLALCIGAGITDHFVGDWRKLLNKLLIIRCCGTLQNTQQEDLGKLNKNNGSYEAFESYITSKLKHSFLSTGISPLEIGEYLMYDSDDDAPDIETDNENNYRETLFAEQVRFAIFSGIKEKAGGTDQDHIVSYFLEHYKEPALATLAAVVKLCIKKDIRNIITYNFDTILDKLVASEKVREAFGAAREGVAVRVYSYQKAEPILTYEIKGAPERHHTTKINIYHVHGVIEDEIGKTQQPVIFSENSYQSYQKTSLNWSNIRLADTMTRFHTLCIGFSGDDANFRMLRHFLSDLENNPVMGDTRDNKKLYLMRSYIDDVVNLADPLYANSQPECAFGCVKTYFNIINAYFEKQLRTHIVWSDNFSEMARQINQLSEWDDGK